MILFYQWNAFMQKGMENALKKLRIEYEVYYDIADNLDKDDAFERRFIDRLEKGIIRVFYRLIICRLYLTYVRR